MQKKWIDRISPDRSSVELQPLSTSYIGLKNNNLMNLKSLASIDPHKQPAH